MKLGITAMAHTCLCAQTPPPTPFKLLPLRNKMKIEMSFTHDLFMSSLSSFLIIQTLYFSLFFPSPMFPPISFLPVNFWFFFLIIDSTRGRNMPGTHSNFNQLALYLVSSYHTKNQNQMGITLSIQLFMPSLFIIIMD